MSAQLDRARGVNEMPARIVRLQKTYTTAGGRQFQVFESLTDGRRVDVCVREGRGARGKYTNAEARELAADKLAGSPAIWVVTCDDHTTEAMTHAEAEKRRDEIVELGACGGAHEIRKGERFR